MSAANFFWVFLGGGIGSICRYGISLLFATYPSNFPWGTLWANIIACLVLGFLVGFNSESILSNQARLLLMTGFCGGFSTFSTFSNENFQLITGGHSGMAITYVILSLMVGVLCIFIGLKAGQLWA